MMKYPKRPETAARNVIIAGTISTKGPTNPAMQNAVVEVMTSDGKSLTDIAYGISSISHIDFYVESSEALASGVSVTVTASAPGRKSKMFYALSSDVHALKTIMLELESAENTRLITENTLANAETIETANGDVMVTLLQGTSFSKTLDGTAPEGGTVARVVAMKQTSQRLDAKGAYQTLDQGEALTGSIIVKLFLEDFDSNPVSLNSAIKVKVKTSAGPLASDFEVKVPDSVAWTTPSLVKTIVDGFFEVNVPAAEVAKGPGIIRIDVPV